MKSIAFLLFIAAISLNAFDGRNYDIKNQEDPYKPFAEVMPETVGGLESVFKKISYPETARKVGIEGKVYVLVYVNETGLVDDVKIVKGIGGGCDEAAVNAFKNASFTPGKEKGIPVKVKVTIPVTFKLK